MDFLHSIKAGWNISLLKVVTEINSPHRLSSNSGDEWIFYLNKEIS